jgi:fatty acid desaturase
LILWAGATTLFAWRDGRLAAPGCAGLAGLVVVLVAVMQHRLSGLAHEASHSTLLRSRLANELVADLFLMFPLVAITQRYREAHLGHHRWVNDAERDPDLVRLNRGTPHHFPISKRAFWRRYVFQALWPPSILRYLAGRARAANSPGSGLDLKCVYRPRVARVLRGTYWLSVLAAVHVTQLWPVFFLFWIVPLLTVYPMLMQLREIAHHSNAPDDGDLTNSRVFRVNPILAAAIFPYGQSFHLTHHLVARVPHYRLAAAHALLCRHRPYRESVVVCRGFFFRPVGSHAPSLLDLLAAPRAQTDSGSIPSPHINARQDKPSLKD